MFAMTVDKLWKSLQFLVIWSQIAFMPSSTNNSFLINNKFTPGISCNIQKYQGIHGNSIHNLHNIFFQEYYAAR